MFVLLTQNEIMDFYLDFWLVLADQSRQYVKNIKRGNIEPYDDKSL